MSERERINHNQVERGGLKPAKVTGFYKCNFSTTPSHLAKRFSGKSHVLFRDCEFAEEGVAFKCKKCFQPIAWTHDTLQIASHLAVDSGFWTIQGYDKKVFFQEFENCNENKEEVNGYNSPTRSNHPENNGRDRSDREQRNFFKREQNGGEVEREQGHLRKGNKASDIPFNVACGSNEHQSTDELQQSAGVQCTTRFTESRPAEPSQSTPSPALEEKKEDERYPGRRRKGNTDPSIQGSCSSKEKSQRRKEPKQSQPVAASYSVTEDHVGRPPARSSKERAVDVRGSFYSYDLGAAGSHPSATLHIFKGIDFPHMPISDSQDDDNSSSESNISENSSTQTWNPGQSSVELPDRQESSSSNRMSQRRCEPKQTQPVAASFRGREEPVGRLTKPPSKHQAMDVRGAFQSDGRGAAAAHPSASKPSTSDLESSLLSAGKRSPDTNQLERRQKPVDNDAGHLQVIERENGIILVIVQGANVRVRPLNAKHSAETWFQARVEDAFCCSCDNRIGWVFTGTECFFTGLLMEAITVV